ncbi:MAG: NigD-like C-terminal domain-containing protein [Marinilabilia sp.]
MKKIILACVLGAFMGVMTGCWDNNNDSPSQYLELGKTGTAEDGDPMVVTDSDLTLKLTDYSENLDFDEVERVLLKYELDEEGGDEDDYDYIVNVIRIQEVVTKDIVEINEENRDTIGTDPLFLNDIWIAGGYLNIDFSFYGDDKTHYINIVKDPDEQTGEETEIYLQVRHDDRDDDALQRYRGLMSFYLDSLQVEGAGKVDLIFEDQDFYSSPFTGFELEYEY